MLSNTEIEGAIRANIVKPRALSTIAADIRKHWAKVNYAAVPYLDAMSELTDIKGRYFDDTAASVVGYFLSNASTWRGDDAKRIKAELRAMLATV